MKFLGVDITWLVEAKLWNKRVRKFHVLAFRTIVDDIGAVRGFLVSSKGFQSGTFEAANNTNVELKTFDSLIADTKEAIESEIFKTHKKRL